MSDVIVVALIGAIGSAVGAGFGVLASAKLTQYRLKKLEEAMNAHTAHVDGLGARVGNLESRMTGAERDIEAIQRHIA